MPRTSIEVRSREKKKVIYKRKRISVSSDFSGKKKVELRTPTGKGFVEIDCKPPSADSVG